MSARADSETRGDIADREKVTELESRVSAVIQRLRDADTIARVSRALLSGEPQEVFALLADREGDVRNAAHECALLRYGYVASVAATACGFDADERDELVQRTFIGLPAAVERARERAIDISHPVGWLRRRAYLIARQMMRERGERVPIDDAEAVPGSPEDALLDALDTHRAAAAISSALQVLAAERPLCAEILRLHYLEGCQLEEVARRLGRAHGTVRNLAHEARTRLGVIIRAQFPHLAGTTTTESRHPRVIR